MDSSSTVEPLSSEPSSPLSDLPKTPSLPCSPEMPHDPSKRYPSPSSTTASGTQTPIKLGEPVYDEEEVRVKLDAVMDGPPPAKRRRITAPKERTTEYLDLTKDDCELESADRRQIDRLLAALRKKKKIVVVAGAGISVSAGIPDFRSSTGLFATARSQHKLKASGKHLFDASVYKNDASTQSFHTMVREMSAMTQKARPTPFHHLLASLAQEGRLLRLYSQNIDCLDTSMEPLATRVPLNPKGPWPTTIQLHGGLEKMVCSKCGQLAPFNGELFDGPEAPLCPSCQVDDEVRTTHAGKRSHGIGRLRPRFVLYNEFNPDGEAIGKVSSADLKTRPDAVIVVGTTLKVPGTRRLVKELCQVTRGRRDGITMWINVDPEPKGAEFKDCWDIVVRSKCDDVARLAALPPWDCSIGDDYLVSQEEDREGQERRSKTTFAVNLPSSPSKVNSLQAQATAAGAKPKQLENVQGIPTPTASPKISATKKPGRATQSKIAFGGKPAKTEQPAKTKVTKPRGRKPKQQPAKANPPKATTMPFKAVKNLAGQPAGKKNPGPAPIKIQPPGTAALPPLRPERRASGDSFCKQEPGLGGDGSKDDASVSDASLSPTADRELMVSGIISPKSAPESLRQLIDMGQ